MRKAEVIRKTLETGATQAEVDERLALNNQQLSLALANTNEQFERTASTKAGKALEKLDDAYGKITRSAQQFIAEQQMQRIGTALGPILA